MNFVLGRLKNLPKRIIFITIFVAILGFAGYRIAATVLAAESPPGGVPTSAADSRLKTLAGALSALGYGSTAPTPDGNWGEMWNRVNSASKTPFNDAIAKTLKNGGNADYPQNVGGVDDYNNNSPIPADSYQASWVTCDAGNSYCGTSRGVAEKQDANTGLVWSGRINSSADWFTANNCKYPNGLSGDDGVCNTNGEVACKCVKLSSSKTGCEGYDDGNWRLPTQKELMMSYIDGSWAQLSDAGTNYWSSTTFSYNTQHAWSTTQYHGYTNYNSKTNNYSVRCVR